MAGKRDMFGGCGRGGGELGIGVGGKRVVTSLNKPTQKTTRPFLYSWIKLVSCAC